MDKPPHRILRLLQEKKKKEINNLCSEDKKYILNENLDLLELFYSMQNLNISLSF